MIKLFRGGTLVGSKLAVSRTKSLRYLSLINRDGRISSSFTARVDDAVTDPVVQNDDKILIVGEFRKGFESAKKMQLQFMH